MKKTLLLATAVIFTLLFSAQATWAKCETVITVPESACVGQTVKLTLNDDPCDFCINYDKVEWTIYDPTSASTVIYGTPIAYTFSMVGSYKVCVKWYDACYGEKYEKCYEVVVTSCCACDMKIVKNESTTDWAGGYIIGAFHINSGSKKVVSMDLSVPYWDYNFEEAGCKIPCDQFATGYWLGNLVKFTQVNGYDPVHAGCFDEFYAREVNWKFPSPQYIDQDFKYVLTVPPTSCKLNYKYCIKVELHYDDCTSCECTICFNGSEVICSCEPAGKAAKSSDMPAELTTANVSIYPNPNGGKFTVKMAHTSESKVIIVTDMTGQMVKKSIVSGDASDLELSNVAPGTYNVTITGGGNTVTKRVVITK